jgi:hypothetical protein
MDPMPIPSIFPVASGFEAMCGKCMKSSATVSGDGPEAAWTALQALGWTPYRSSALCPACTKDPPNVDKDAAKAMRGRKRR